MISTLKSDNFVLVLALVYVPVSLSGRPRYYNKEEEEVEEQTAELINLSSVNFSLSFTNRTLLLRHSNNSSARSRGSSEPKLE